jgi:hypothetical protein
MIPRTDAVEACRVDEPTAIPGCAVAAQPFGRMVIKIFVTRRVVGFVAGEARYSLAAAEANQDR